MKGAPLVLLAWALLLAMNTTVLVVLGGDALEIALLGGAAAGVAVLAVLAAWRRRSDAVRTLPDLSLPSALAAMAVAGLVVGSELGTWLILIAGGLLALALGGLVREGRAR